MTIVGVTTLCALHTWPWSFLVCMWTEPAVATSSAEVSGNKGIVIVGTSSRTRGNEISVPLLNIRVCPCPCPGCNPIQPWFYQNLAPSGGRRFWRSVPGGSTQRIYLAIIVRRAEAEASLRGLCSVGNEVSKVFCSSTHEHVIREESGWYVLGRASTDSTTSERQAAAARCVLN